MFRLEQQANKWLKMYEKLTFGYSLKWFGGYKICFNEIIIQ